MPQEEQTHEVTEEHYKLFVSECNRWVFKLGLLDWQITYHHKSYGKYRAFSNWDNVTRIAAIVLAKEWVVSPPTTESVKYCALHEVLHLLLSDLSPMFCYTQTEADRLEAERHRVIWTLTNSLLKEENENDHQ